MTIEKNISGGSAVLSLTGWLDSQSAPELGQAVEALGPGITSLVLDLTGLEYTASAGIRQIVSAYKQMNGALTLRNVSPEVMDVLNMTGLGKKLHIEQS